MRVLENHQDRRLTRQRLDLADQRFKRLLTALLGRQFQCGKRPSFGIESISARSAVSSWDVDEVASKPSSLSSFAFGSSSRASPAARAMCPMIG